MHLSSYNDDPSRDWSADRLRSYVLELIDHILILASETDPRNGPESESGKDFKVWKALVRMSEISETIAGWAIHHQAGLAINGLKRINPAASPEMAENPQYVDNLSKLNSHENEIAGRACDENELSSDVARRILANCLSANPAGISKTLSDKLVSALRALEFGETLELFKADDPYRKVRWEELQHQLRAVLLIEYRCKRGFKKYKAQDDVAEMYGVSKDAIRRWEGAVRKELGNLAVASALDGARNAALLEEDAVRGRVGGTPKGYFDREYGADALKLAGAAYQTFKRRKKSDPSGS